MLRLLEFGGSDEARDQACDALLPAPFFGGGTLVVGDTELGFDGLRIAVDVCLLPTPPRDRPLAITGTDAAMVLSTGLGRSILGEARYRQWAEDSGAPALEDLPAPMVARVAALVRMTETHRPVDDDGRALCDADLAILAAPPERYAEYVAGVRHEYFRFDDVTFAAGRAAVLRDLLGRDRLYATATGRRLWERRARANLTEELASCGAAPQPPAD